MFDSKRRSRAILTEPSIEFSIGTTPNLTSSEEIAVNTSGISRYSTNS
jgi:hypothetical protein